jgi:hypothetical protein
MDNGERSEKCICCAGFNTKKSPAVLMPFLAKRIFDLDPLEISPEWGLRDLREGMAYFICHSVQCQTCGALFLDYRFSNDELNKLYLDYRGPVYTKLREKFEPGYAKRNELFKDQGHYISGVENFLLSHLPNPINNILDWGGDSGINTPLKAFAKNIWIYDISNVEVVKGTNKIDHVQLADYKYDLIVCAQVLEHIAKPDMLLEEIRGFMGKNTLLYLEMPFEPLIYENNSSLDLHEKKRHWHEHINFFTVNSIEALVGRVGLSVIETKVINPKNINPKDRYLAFLCKTDRV